MIGSCRCGAVLTTLDQYGEHELHCRPDTRPWCNYHHSRDCACGSINAHPNMLTRYRREHPANAFQR